jgi:exodeoxyribonuclease-3
VKITTWNVNGVRAREAQVLEWAEREAPDVLALQEVKASPDQVPQPLTALPGYWGYWHGYKGYSGVALLVKKSTFGTRPEFFHPSFDHEHRIVALRAGNVVIASVYVPNGNKDYAAKVRFLEAMDTWVQETLAAGAGLVLCGDLNVALEGRDVHPSLRKPEQIGQTAEEQALLGRILGRGLTDLLRHYDRDNDRLFTWWAPWRNSRERNIGWRLDYVLVSPSLLPSATACSVRRDFGTSDHGPVTAELSGSIVPFVHGPDEPPPPAPKGQLSLL